MLYMAAASPRAAKNARNSPGLSPVLVIEVEQQQCPALLRRIPTLRLATELDQIPFKHDGFVYGVYELPVAW